MMTLTLIEDKIYIGVDYPTPRPEIPKIFAGKVYELYEYTYSGPKYIGKYMAKDRLEKTVIGPLKIIDTFSVIIEYRGYYQYVEVDPDKNCLDCTPYETFTESIQKLLYTDRKDFLYAQLDEFYLPREDSILWNYNVVTYVDGVLRLGEKIRKIDEEELKIGVEGNKIYYYTLDTTKIPPASRDKTELIELPFRIRNGKIKRIRAYGNRLVLHIEYPDNVRLKLYYSTTTKRPYMMRVYRGKNCETIYTGEELDPQIIELLAQRIDEGGIEAYEMIKHLGDVPIVDCW